MRHKKIFIPIIAMLIAVFGILLPSAYAANGSDRVVLHYLREIPLEAQKYTLAGESENWIVKCDRYDGIIFSFPKGEKKLLQDIALTLDYKGASENVPVTFSMEVGSMFSNHLRQLFGEDMLSSTETEHRTIWFSAGSYPEEAPSNRLPMKDEALSIAITTEGKTEVVPLTVTDLAGLPE